MTATRKRTEQKEDTELSRNEGKSTADSTREDKKSLLDRVYSWFLCIQACMKKIHYGLSFCVMPEYDPVKEDLGDTLRKANQWKILTVIEKTMYHSLLITIIITVIIYTANLSRSQEFPSLTPLVWILIFYFLAHFSYYQILRKTYGRYTYERHMLNIIDTEEPTEDELEKHHKKVEIETWESLSLRTLPLFSYLKEAEQMPWVNELPRLKLLARQRNMDIYYRQKVNEAVRHIDKRMDKVCRENAFYVGPNTMQKGIDKSCEIYQQWFKRETENCGKNQEPYLEDIRIAARKIGDLYKEINENKVLFKPKSADPELGTPGEIHVELLRKSSADLVQRLDLEPLFVSSLISKGVVSQIFSENLNNEVFPRAVRVRNLIGKLLQYPRANFDGFLEALRESNQGHLAEMIDERVNQK